MFKTPFFKASTYLTLTAQNNVGVNSFQLKILVPQQWLLQLFGHFVTKTPSMPLKQLIKESCLKDLLRQFVVTLPVVRQHFTSSCDLALPYVYVLACFQDISLNPCFRIFDV